MSERPVKIAETKSTAKSISMVMVLSLVSRLMAFGSSIVYMTMFGNTPDLNVYSFAITIPNIIFNSAGTAISTIVIPLYAGFIVNKEFDRANRFSDNILSISVVFSLALTAVGIALAPAFLYFSDSIKAGSYDYAVFSIRIMFPVMVFYALNYVFQGMLQSIGKYNMPAMVSIPSSLIIIVYVLTMGSRFGVTGLLFATFIGLALQALILVPSIIRSGYRYHFSMSFKDPDIRKALSLIPPVLVGTSAFQINMLYNNMRATSFEGVVTLLNFVQNIILYSILMFIYAITSVMFPKLTMLISQGNMSGYKDNLIRILKSVSFFLIPATVGFIMVRTPLLNLMLSWGKITPKDVDVSTGLLALYALGILGIGFKEILDRAFYANKDTKLPAINSFIIVGVNISASILLTNIIGAYGIPLAYSLSALIGGAVLLILMRKKIGPYGLGKLFISIIKTTAGALVMAAVLIPLQMLLDTLIPGAGVVPRICKLIIPCCVGGLVFGAVTWLLRVDEAKMVVDTVLSRIKGRLAR